MSGPPPRKRSPVKVRQEVVLHVSSHAGAVGKGHKGTGVRVSNHGEYTVAWTATAEPKPRMKARMLQEQPKAAAVVCKTAKRVRPGLRPLALPCRVSP